MPRKIKQYTNPFLKAKATLVAHCSSGPPNLQSAIELHQMGQLGQAEALYLQLLEIEPSNADALHLLGVIAYQTGNHQAAVDLIGQAIEVIPNVASYYSNRGNALQQLKQFEAALANYDQAIELKPDLPDVYSNRGVLLKELKQFDAAVASYDKAIELKPDLAEAYSNRGIALKELKKFDAAVASYDKAIELKPDYAEAYSNRGNALQELKQFDAAVISCEKAIEFKPDLAEAYSNLGNALKGLKQFDAAVASYDKAIELKPDLADTYSNRGNALQELKQFDAAVASYDKAIELKPDYADAYSNRGVALKELKQFNAAVASYDKAIEFKPDLAEAYSNRGNALQELEQFDAAVASYDKAFDLNPNNDYLFGTRLYARMFVCEWSDLSKSLTECESEITKGKLLIPPLIVQTFFDKPDLHLLVSKMYKGSESPKTKILGEISKRSDEGKIRIGYYSADLYYHPVTIWLAEQIENHNKSKFELFAFSFNSDINDPMSARLRVAFDHFIEVDKMSDLEVTKLSRELGIDIAVDLGGFTKHSRTGIFAERAAPIQVNHLGFPGSMGKEYIDYIISDVHVIPESAQKHYTERVAYVPCQYTYDGQRQVSEEPLSRAQFGLPENCFVFTCQNRCQKFMPEVFGIWMEILKATPGSVLWLMEPHPSAVVNLTKEAQARGVASNRLVFTKRLTVAMDQESARIGRYLASYRLADLFLDTWPYNGGTTAIDALWAGLPVLTKAGISAVARMATSALHAIEVPELITSTSQEYLELAVQLASDPQKIKHITDKVQEKRVTSALFNAARNTQYIEAAYTKMYERYYADLAPDYIYI